MNDSPIMTKIGTVGELLIQIRLFQYNVEMSIPVIDSGNDLIAIKKGIFRAIQVKTKKYETKIWHLENMPEKYHILALIKLASNAEELDNAQIYLLSKEQVNRRQSISDNEVLLKYKLSNEIVNFLFNSN